MSRYESSRFVKDPKTMNKEILKAACDKLGWTYRIQGVLSKANHACILYTIQL